MLWEIATYGKIPFGKANLVKTLENIQVHGMRSARKPIFRSNDPAATQHVGLCAPERENAEGLAECYRIHPS